MVEVFKTNVTRRRTADRLLRRIHNEFNCRANFDLTDCDRVLRIAMNEQIDTARLIQLVETAGFKATVLPDELPTGLLRNLAADQFQEAI